MSPHQRRGAWVAQDACHIPSCGKSRPKVKLSRCGGCRSAVYCSAACQKAHWPQHKKHCQILQKQHEHNELIAEYARMNNPMFVSPAEARKELDKFLSHFGSSLMHTALSWFRPGRHDPAIRGWEEDSLLLHVSRRPNVPAQAPAWARFEVDGLQRINFESLDAWIKEDPDYIETGFQEGRAKHTENAKRRGPGYGVFSTWVCASFDTGGPEPSTLKMGNYLLFEPDIAKFKYLSPGYTPESYIKLRVKMESDAALAALK